MDRIPAKIDATVEVIVANKQVDNKLVQKGTYMHVLEFKHRMNSTATATKYL